MFFLLSDPLQYARIRGEIDLVFAEGDDALDTSKYEDLKILDACM